MSSSSPATSWANSGHLICRLLFELRPANERTRECNQQRCQNNDTHYQKHRPVNEAT
ncbi:hypothetical protein [Marinobacter sp. LV10R510-11A]|uniref:hypothetical protein n=1 Tax=Marinobacter sp. LV10R510-11A TaxID=1415568 RepID=UPI001D0CF6D9|nr:hypothetical protein [Marinobacter sp. LV10R510-11A]